MPERGGDQSQDSRLWYSVHFSSSDILRHYFVSPRVGFGSEFVIIVDSDLQSGFGPASDTRFATIVHPQPPYLHYLERIAWGGCDGGTGLTNYLSERVM